MRRLVSAMLAATLVATLAAPGSAQIVRHAAPPGPVPAIILQGVTVPAGSETLYLSGQLAAPIDPARAGKPDLTLADFGDTKTQTISVFNKIRGLLAARGYAMADIIKLTVFVSADPKTPGRMDSAGFNEGYRMFFGTKDNPNLVARSTVQVAGLAAPHFLIEIEATAAKSR